MTDGVKKEREITSRREPSQVRARERVDKILAETAGLLTSSGLEKLTTNHIAKAAGMSVGSLYRYFPNKQAIIYELYKRWLAEVREGLTAFRDSIAPDEPIESIEERMFSSVYGDINGELDFSDLDVELGKAMQLYPELQEMDRLHGLKIAELLRDIFKLAGAVGDDVQLLQLGSYLYAANDSLHGAVEAGVPIVKALQWHRQAVRAVLAPYLRPVQ